MTKVPPVRMIGNLYFVGTVEASSHLIDTGDGYILIDTGYEETADVIIESMGTLGFDLKDIKIILHSHGHYDHTDGTKKILSVAPQAKTYLSFHDIRYIKGFTPDFDIRDGDVIRLGNTEIKCLFTPGHTEGSVSFFMDVVEDGKTYRAAMFGGAGVKQLRKDFMHEWKVPYLCRGLFFSSVERLLQEKVDVMIGNHSWQNHTLEKRDKMAGATINPFIEPLEWETYLKRLHASLWRVINAEIVTKFIHYAHRGASDYFPENTMSAFRAAVEMGANGIETDVQRTKDGVLVLFHDDTLARVTGQEGRICDYTYTELQQFFVRKGERMDTIPTLENFLSEFAEQAVSFAIELKVDGIEKDVADLVYKYGADKKTMITSFALERIKAVKEYAPFLRVGHLTKVVDDGEIQALLALGADEICPHSSIVNADMVATLHHLGFNVRAWGVGNEERMKALCLAGVDGMTYNAPDVLSKYVAERTV